MQKKTVDTMHATFFFSVFQKLFFHTVTLKMFIRVSTNHAAARSTNAAVTPSLWTCTDMNIYGFNYPVMSKLKHTIKRTHMHNIFQAYMDLTSNEHVGTHADKLSPSKSWLTVILEIT